MRRVPRINPAIRGYSSASGILQGGFCRAAILTIPEKGKK